jgi:hypothetical protein
MRLPDPSAEDFPTEIGVIPEDIPLMTRKFELSGLHEDILELDTTMPLAERLNERPGLHKDVFELDTAIPLVEMLRPGVAASGSSASVNSTASDRERSDWLTHAQAPSRSLYSRGKLLTNAAAWFGRELRKVPKHEHR